LNFTGVKVLGPGGLLDIYIFEEGELETALRELLGGDGSEFFQWVMASPLKIADGSMIPDSAWAAAGSNMRLEVNDCLLSLSTDLVCWLEDEVSVLLTTEDCDDAD